MTRVSPPLRRLSRILLHSGYTPPARRVPQRVLCTVRRACKPRRPHTADRCSAERPTTALSPSPSSFLPTASVTRLHSPSRRAGPPFSTLVGRPRCVLPTSSYLTVPPFSFRP